MATIGFAGVFVKLKDKSIQLKERLKLFRFAWKTNSVFIPNKESVLIDLLGGYLLDEKRDHLSEEDIASIWACLHDVLHTRRLQVMHTQGKELVVKQSLAQLITEAITNIAQGRLSGLMTTIIGCCQAIVTSPGLAHIFTGRLDLMLSVICSLCDLLCNEGNQSSGDQLSNLLCCMTERYLKLLQTAPNQNQILQSMCDKLLPTVIQQWSETPKPWVRKSADIFLVALMHKDHQHGLNLFLKSGATEGKLNKRAKMASHVFTTMDTILQSKSGKAEKMALFLSKVFKSYVIHNCHDGNLSNAFNLFVQLCHLIGWRSGGATLYGTVPPAAALRGVNLLLQEIKNNDLYSVTGDEGNVQLKFYRSLAKTIAATDCYCSDWFCSMRVMLELSHLIVEPVLSDVLARSWLENTQQMDQEAMQSRDSFLAELTITYNKLRQIPKVIRKIIDCLCSCQRDKPLQTSPNFEKSFGDVVQSLPQAVIVDVWKLLITAIKENFVIKETRTENKGFYPGLAHLFHMFLMNVRVADYSITEIISNIVEECMVTMETDILTPMLQSKDNAENLLYTFNLCHAWGEVMAMLALYKQYRASNLQTCELVSHPHNLSYLHNYMDGENWKKLYKRIQKEQNTALLYIWEVLLLQKARTILLFREPDCWGVARDIMATVLTPLQEAVETSLTSAVVWSKSLDDMSKKTIFVARWSLVAGSLSVLQCAMSADQLRTVADLVVQTYLTSTKCGGMSAGQVTEQLLRTEWMRQSAGIQSYLVSNVLSVWQQCFSSSTVPKAKKRKSSSGLTPVYKLLDMLSSKDLEWTPTQSSEAEGKLKQVGACMTAVLEDKEGIQSLPQINKLLNSIRIIEALPLEGLRSCDQMRCLTGLLAVLAVLNKFEAQSKEEKSSSELLTSKCLSMCTELLESSRAEVVINVLDQPVFLTWLYEQIKVINKRGLHHLYPQFLLLVEVACTLVLSSKDKDKLSTLVPWVTQLCSKMSTYKKNEDIEGILGLSSFFLHRISKILTRVYLRDDLQAICIPLYLSLSKTLLELSPMFSNSSTSENSKALLAHCYASILSVHFMEDEVKTAFLTMFPSALNWCQKLLQTKMDSSDLFVKMCALHFIQSISKYHTNLDRVFTESTKLDIWMLLVNLLKNMLIDQSNVNENQTDQSNLISKKDHTYKKQINQTHTEHYYEITNEESRGESSRNTDQVYQINYILENKEEKRIDRTRKRKDLSRTDTNVKGTSDNSWMEQNDLDHWYRCLVFEKRVSNHENRIQLLNVQNAMATLLTSLKEETFSQIMDSLVNNVHCSRLLTDRIVVQSSLYIWRQLLHLELPEEQAGILHRSARNMMLNFQSILQQLHHHEDENVQLCIVLPVLHTQHQILSLSQKILPAQMLLLCLHSCAFAPLEGSTYFSVFHAMCDILDTLLSQHEKIVLQSIPAYIGCAKKLLLSVVDQSDQEKVSHDPIIVDGLKSCAHQMERLFSLIGSHKVEFGKVARYVVADYVAAVQKVTLVPVVKRALVPAVYKMLDICDKHAVAQLHAVLPDGVIDVFKLLYSDYIKFHRYQGRI